MIQFIRHGNTGIVVFRSSSFLRESLRVGACLTFFLGAGVQAALFAFAPQHVTGWWLVLPAPTWVLEAGFIVATLGMAFMLAAQLDLGASWRIGIDELASPGLVTGGLYRFCRNPIYVGLIAGLVGIAIVLPTFSTLGLLVSVAWCVRSQTIDEEAYLERKYGDVFRRYSARVGRFFPGLGLLRSEGEPAQS